MKILLTIAIITFWFCAIGQDMTKEALVSDFERGKAMSLAYIDAMPKDKFDFKPTPESRSFAEQMLHLAQGTIGLSANGTGANRLYPDANLEKEESLKSKAEVRRIVTETFDFAIAGIKDMDGAAFNEIVERGPFKVTRLGWFQKANEHVSHHRGQCATYLRLASVVPPEYQLF